MPRLQPAPGALVTPQEIDGCAEGCAGCVMLPFALVRLAAPFFVIWLALKLGGCL